MALAMCAFPGPCSGKLHEYQTKKIMEVDGTSVHIGPWVQIYICEKHYQDREDPKFLKCMCRLCIGNKS